MKEHERRRGGRAVVRTVPIANLKAPGELYPRFQPNSEVVERYQERLDDMPRIVADQPGCLEP